MADQSADPSLGAVLKQIWPLAPGFTGVLISLAWGESLSTKGKLIALVGGFACALWLSPAIVAVVTVLWPPAAGMQQQLTGGFGLAVGMFAMTVAASLAGFLKKFFGDPFKLLKVQIGPVTFGGSIDDATPPPDGGV